MMDTRTFPDLLSLMLTKITFLDFLLEFIVFLDTCIWNYDLTKSYNHHFYHHHLSFLQEHLVPVSNL